MPSLTTEATNPGRDQSNARAVVVAPPGVIEVPLDRREVIHAAWADPGRRGKVGVSVP
ncbi:MAG: hypothetical protein ACRDJY_10235 [Thermoleophilaceae bacterium]